MRQGELFYASGCRGSEVRADGNGGTLPRGWYVIGTNGGRLGPFRTKTAAKSHSVSGSGPVGRRAAA